MAAPGVCALSGETKASISAANKVARVTPAEWDTAETRKGERVTTWGFTRLMHRLNIGSVLVSGSVATQRGHFIT